MSEHVDTEELLPCPFCGNAVRWCGEHNPDPSDDHDCHQIRCDNCCIQFDVDAKIINADTLDEVKALMSQSWNRRPLKNQKNRKRIRNHE